MKVKSIRYEKNKKIVELDDGRYDSVEYIYNGTEEDLMKFFKHVIKEYLEENHLINL